MVVEIDFFVSGEITVRALVFLSVYDILMVILGVALEETTRLELLPTQHTRVHCKRLAVRSNDDR